MQLDIKRIGADIVADYANLPSLLSLSLAVCAGYYFQARYIVTAVGSLTAARVIAVICCLALAVMVKGLMQQVKQNAALDAFVEKYAKPALGIMLIVFAVAIDAITSNVSIDNAQASSVVDKVKGSIDRSAILDLMAQRSLDQKKLADLDSAAARLGTFAFAKRRLTLEKAIAEKSSLIAEAEKANANTVSQANMLLVGAVGSGKGINGAMWGFYLMALIVGLEIFAPAPARANVKAMAMVKTIEHTDSVSHTRRISEHVQQVPVAPAKFEKPQNWEEACRMVVAGELDWSGQRIKREYPGLSLYRVQGKIKALRSPSPKDGDGNNSDLPD